jgi:hypothetical protein
MWPDNEEPRGVARFRRAQRNAFWRQIEIEESYAHNCKKIAPEPAAITATASRTAKTPAKKSAWESAQN